MAKLASMSRVSSPRGALSRGVGEWVGIGACGRSATYAPGSGGRPETAGPLKGAEGPASRRASARVTRACQRDPRLLDLAVRSALRTLRSGRSSGAQAGGGRTHPTHTGSQGPDTWGATPSHPRRVGWPVQNRRVGRQVSGIVYTVELATWCLAPLFGFPAPAQGRSTGRSPREPGARTRSHIPNRSCSLTSLDECTWARTVLVPRGWRRCCRGVVRPSRRALTSAPQDEGCGRMA